MRADEAQRERPVERRARSTSRSPGRRATRAPSAARGSSPGRSPRPRALVVRSGGRRSQRRRRARPPPRPACSGGCVRGPPPAPRRARARPPRSCPHVRQHLLAEEPDLLVPVRAPELEHHVRAAGVAVLLDRARCSRPACRRSAGTCRAARPRPSPSRRAGRPAPSPRRPAGSRPARSRRARAACRRSRGCSAPCSRGTCRRSRARRRGPASRSRLVDRGDDRAADVDLAADVLARVADEAGRRDRRRQAAVGDLAGELLHLRRRRRDVDRRHARAARAPRARARARRRSTCRRRSRTRSPREDAAHDRRPRRASARASSSSAVLRVVEEDLRRPEAEDEAARPGGLLHDARVHRDLHRMARERRDDPPADRQPLRLARHQRRDDRRGARLHPVLAPPRVRLGEPDRVHAGLVHRPRRREHLVERLHRELHDADPERRRQAPTPRGVGRPLRASCTCSSSAPRTCCTCWFTIGCRTRWPIEPTGPAIFTSAAQAIAVPPSAASESVNDVCMFIIAPTPLPLTRELRELGLALLDLLHVDLHLQAAEAERDLHVRASSAGRPGCRSSRRRASSSPSAPGR